MRPQSRKKTTNPRQVVDDYMSHLVQKDFVRAHHFIGKEYGYDAAEIVGLTCLREGLTKRHGGRIVLA